MKIVVLDWTAASFLSTFALKYTTNYSAVFVGLNIGRRRWCTPYILLTYDYEFTIPFSQYPWFVKFSSINTVVQNYVLWWLVGLVLQFEHNMWLDIFIYTVPRVQLATLCYEQIISSFDCNNCFEFPKDAAEFNSSYFNEIKYS